MINYIKTMLTSEIDESDKLDLLKTWLSKTENKVLTQSVIDSTKLKEITEVIVFIKKEIKRIER